MPQAHHAAAVTPGGRSRERPEDHVTLTPELTDAYLQRLRDKGRTPATLQTYRRNLDMLYRYLPKDKRISWDTLEGWRAVLLAEGYAPRTINLCLSAANGLLEYCGRREFQSQGPLKLAEDVQPELTRSEYLRLLSTARALGKERSYLLVKVFGSMGLAIQELPRLTVQAVQAGRLVLAGNRLLPIPTCLQRELLDFAGRKGIRTGPLFITRAGRPMSRSNVTGAIQALCPDARVEKEKGNPRCLKKLYQTTQAGIQADLALLMEQAYDRILETEQLTIGWSSSGEASGF